MSELKPCPFCGKPLHVFYNYRLKAWTWHCDTENCAGTMLGYDSADEAVAALNRRAQPANEPLTLEQLREMGGPSPIWKEEPPSGDMTESRVEPVLFNGVHQRGKEEIVCWVTCKAHHANARVEHIAAGRINFYRWPPERSADGKT